MLLKNDIIHLRYYEETDLDFLMTIRPNPENYDFFGEFEPYSKEMQRQWWKSKTGLSNELNYIVAKNKDNKPIGTVSLINIDYRNRHCELSRFFIKKQARIGAVGFMVEKMIQEYAFMHLNMHKIWLQVIESNTRAILFYSRFDFKKEGVLRENIYKNGQYENIIIMSMLKQEYVNKYNS